MKEADEHNPTIIATKCVLCGSKSVVNCSKCKTIICANCYKPVNQIFCELCLEKLPNHKTGCDHKMEWSYMRFSHIPFVYKSLGHETHKV